MKHISNFNRTLAILFSILVLFTSCASTTMIESIPSGAKLYLDGEPVGTTPYSMTDEKIIGSCTSVKIQKENYIPFYTDICRDEEPNLNALVGGFFFWPVWFWAMGYKPTHIYELSQAGGQSASDDTDSDSLDVLWKDKVEKTKTEKAETTNQTDEQPVHQSKVMKLDEAKPISDEEFHEQKLKDE
ncbi:MAG: PEGA domain-containing protein [Prolixibacteraceae bacterium]|nr:PEGA domain-containing protein [Prolixibacteraceae bacterium]